MSSWTTLSNTVARKFPKGWRDASADAQEIYRIEAELGNHFLRARADNKSVQIGLEYLFNPKKLRQLRWRWRVRALPVGANERNADKHHAAAQVYVIFDSPNWPRVIKFTWSTSLSPGSRFTHPLYDRGRVVVLRSGPADAAIWLEEKVPRRVSKALRQRTGPGAGHWNIDQFQFDEIAGHRGLRRFRAPSLEPLRFGSNKPARGISFTSRITVF